MKYIKSYRVFEGAYSRRVDRTRSNNEFMQQVSDILLDTNDDGFDAHLDSYSRRGDDYTDISRVTVEVGKEGEFKFSAIESSISHLLSFMKENDYALERIVYDPASRKYSDRVVLGLKFKDYIDLTSYSRDKKQLTIDLIKNADITRFIKFYFIKKKARPYQSLVYNKLHESSGVGSAWSLTESEIKEMLYDITDNGINIWIINTRTYEYGLKEVHDGQDFLITFRKSERGIELASAPGLDISWEEVREGIGHITSYLSDRYRAHCVVSFGDVGSTKFACVDFDSYSPEERTIHVKLNESGHPKDHLDPTGEIVFASDKPLFHTVQLFFEDYGMDVEGFESK